ncbi:unnamed protein product [Lymnaea stagnalis]|uniref:Uncharacterized protein n=1 Tax=Lymnaea stagnalis TaxID=6523 RepID=A0AAV2H9W2_LYMST
MGSLSDWCVRSCAHLNSLPAAVMCISLFGVQAGVMDYYLVSHLSITYHWWLLADAFNLALLIASIIYSGNAIERQRNSQRGKDIPHSISWLSWLLMSISSSVKIVLVIKLNAMELEKDPSFFGPNTFKTAIALASCIFLFLLNTQHDSPFGSERREYISDLTGTVVFDILDTVDILEVCFTPDDRDSLWDGLEEFILAQASLNIILPTVPLLTLSRTQFGRDGLTRPMICLHRLLVVLVVNVPNLITRLILWHGVSVGISPFFLKNVIVIGMTLYEFYEHKRDKVEGHRKEELELRDSPRDVHGEFVAAAENNVNIADGEAFPGGGGSSRKWSRIKSTGELSSTVSE